MQYSVHSPNEFIVNHSGQLLPSWSHPILSVLVILQKCQLALLDRTLETETNKHDLREQFFQLGSVIVCKLREMGYLADMFDPRTGLPMTSSAGSLRLDDVAVVRSILGYAIADRGGCSIVVHPVWGYAVYPSTLVSSAEPEVMEWVVNQVVGCRYPVSTV